MIAGLEYQARGSCVKKNSGAVWYLRKNIADKAYIAINNGGLAK
jgi:hypothetical protein